MESALKDFGFASLSLSASDFLAAEAVIQLGVEPFRIDLISSISGIDFDDAWSDRVSAELDDVHVWVISVRAFRKNKLAAGRKKDLADLADLLDQE